MPLGRSLHPRTGKLRCVNANEQTLEIETVLREQKAYCAEKDSEDEQFVALTLMNKRVEAANGRSKTGRGSNF